jgi:hypothetical protein
MSDVMAKVEENARSEFEFIWSQSNNYSKIFI